MGLTTEFFIVLTLCFSEDLPKLCVFLYIKETLIGVNLYMCVWACINLSTQSHCGELPSLWAPIASKIGVRPVVLMLNVGFSEMNVSLCNARH